MGSKERRERQRAETRHKILDAARELFVNRGYEATTMREIARRIEYTPTAIYHHFRSKEALLFELCETDFGALARVFREAAQTPDPIERLDRIGDAYVQFALTHPMHYQLLFMTRRPPMDSLNDGIAADPGERAYALLRRACADAISAGRFRPEYDDPDEVAQILWSGLHGILSLNITKEQESWIEWRDVARTAARIREIAARGLTLQSEG